jgi:hypothetical protein
MPVKSKYAAEQYSTVPNGMQLLNVIRSDASQAYKDRVPEATQDNIAEIGNPILNYEATRNEFLDALVNRIGMVIITSRSYNNPLKRFKKGMMSLGETVEEIFVNIIKAEPYYLVDDQGKTAAQDEFERRLPNVLAAFHKRNRQDKYPVTIQNDDLRTAFLSYQGVEDLVSKIIEAVYTSDEYDEFLLMKNVFFEAGMRGALRPVTVPGLDSDVNAKKTMTLFRQTALDLTFMRSDSNFMGVTTHTPLDEQVIFILSSVAATVDVEVLASAFNMDKTNFIGRRVIVDDFGGLEKEGVIAIAADEDWFMVFDNYLTMTSDYVASRLYYNYFLHHWETLSYSPFKNVVAFTTEAPTVKSVTITPGTASVTKAAGGTVQLTAAVTGTGLISNNVVWTITEDANASVNSSGLVTIKPGITVDSLTVTATSKLDNTKSGTATITLT